MLERFSAPLQALANGSIAEAECVGNGLHGLAALVIHHKGIAIDLWNRLQGIPKASLLLPIQGGLKWRWLIANGSRKLFIVLCRCPQDLSVALAKSVSGAVAGDAAKPSSEFFGIAQRRDFVPGDNENVLANVLT